MTGSPGKTGQHKECLPKEEQACNVDGCKANVASRGGERTPAGRAHGGQNRERRQGEWKGREKVCTQTFLD